MSSKSSLNRREFLEKSSKGTIGLAAGLTAAGMMPLSSNKIKAEAEKSSSSIKVSLYTITYLGIWYDDRALTLKECMDRAKSYGYDGIEFDGKRPHICPLDQDRKDCQELRRYADKLGLEICGVAGNNNFTSPIPEQRWNELLMVREQIKIASYLGAKVVRLFAAWGGTTVDDSGIASYGDARKSWNLGFPNVTDEQRWKWCKECLEESVKYAERYGVILAFQNHAPLVADYKVALKMVKEISSENLKMSLDALSSSQDPEYIRAAVREVGKDINVHHHFGGEFDKMPDGRIILRGTTPERKDNTPVFVKALADIGYNGHLAYELCHQFRIGNRFAKLKDVEEQAALAVQYMKNIISENVT